MRVSVTLIVVKHTNYLHFSEHYVTNIIIYTVL